MPGRSALAAALDQEASWSVQDYLLAELIDRLELSIWLFIEANSERNDIPFPKPFPRPGEQSRNEEMKEAPPRTFLAPGEVAALFSGKF